MVYLAGNNYLFTRGKWRSMIPSSFYKACKKHKSLNNFVDNYDNSKTLDHERKQEAFRGNCYIFCL